MSLKRIAEWRKLPVTLSELCIDTTLRCGQSFRWRKLDDEWVCTLHGRILALKQDESHLHYRVTWPQKPLTPPHSGEGITEITEKDDTEDLLRHYFSLNLDLTELYDHWSEVDSNFRRRAPSFGGVRILNQDPWETLLAFICSSNNNISRISQMVHKLCKHYGPLLGYVDDEAMHDFPMPADLTGEKVESHLRELGFGYRARYIAEAARKVAVEKPSNWLDTLRNPDNPSFGAPPIPVDDQVNYKTAHQELLALSGVGPKVADCVCLMGLAWGESVPVDTHVWQIAQRDYKFGKTKTKTFNKAMYDAVGDHFRALWGPYAGWAHSVLFTADLREFADRSPAKKVKAEVKTEVKAEVAIKEEPASPSSGAIKRKRVVTEAEIKTEVKEEVSVADLLFSPEVSSKRRLTRASVKIIRGSK